MDILDQGVNWCVPGKPPTSTREVIHISPLVQDCHVARQSHNQSFPMERGGAPAQASLIAQFSIPAGKSSQCIAAYRCRR